MKIWHFITFITFHYVPVTRLPVATEILDIVHGWPFKLQAPVRFRGPDLPPSSGAKEKRQNVLCWDIEVYLAKKKLAIL